VTKTFWLKRESWGKRQRREDLSVVLFPKLAPFNLDKRSRDASRPPGQIGRYYAITERNRRPQASLEGVEAADWDRNLHT
jgi:hypothetical protein